jgi:leader peptidase (prepilin peptidase)/N-methyltransferase
LLSGISTFYQLTTEQGRISLMNSEPLILTFAALFGAIVGSFLNVVILRLPHPEESIVFPASHCPKCQAGLRWYENIPLLSYVFLGGRCSHCRCRISLQYPSVEAAMALLSTAVVYRFGFTITGGGFFLFSAALLVIIFIDLQHQIIPDMISLPGIMAGFILSFFSPLISWLDSLIGILCGGGILYGIALLYFFLRKQEGMGGGDIKLLAMIGAFLGWQALPFVIFASSLSGALVGILVMVIERQEGLSTRIPFGPFLSLAALMYMLFSQDISTLYLSYLDGSLF